MSKSNDKSLFMRIDKEHEEKFNRLKENKKMKANELFMYLIDSYDLLYKIEVIGKDVKDIKNEIKKDKYTKLREKKAMKGGNTDDTKYV